MILSQNLKIIFSEIIHNLYPNLKEAIDIEIEIPANSMHGDYSCNIALRISKKVKESPLSIAEKIAYEFRKIKREYIKEVNVLKPGFINIFIETKILCENVTEINKLKYDFGKSTTDSNSKIILEFTDPNPFKEFHIGHVYTNTVGESLCRLQEYTGKVVKRANYQGDVGMHVAKSIWGMITKFQNEKITLEELSKKEIHEKIQFLGQAYALGSQSFEANPEVSEEIKNINYQVYISAQNFLKEEKNWFAQIDYQQYLKESKYEISFIEKLYKVGRSWSLEYFEILYKRLGTKFDFYFFESIVGEYGMKIVLENLEKGLFEKHEGAIVFRGEKYGLHTRVFVNSLGLPTYEAKELGLAPTKYEQFQYDQSVIITGNEIEEYFKVLICALNKINPKLGQITKHIPHGMVRLPEGKMSSRTGKVITGENFLDLTREEARKKFTNKDKAQSEELFEKIAIGAIKYAFLKTSIGKDIIFDINDSLSLHGNSGPYLQYTFARIQSLLRKNKNTSQNNNETNNILLEEQEQLLLRLLIKFPEIVQEAANTYCPNLVCNYLFELAQKFNNFYDKLPILSADESVKNFRIDLSEATGWVIHNGLYIIGIDAPDKM